MTAGLPRSLRVLCAAGGVPLAGAWVTATLLMHDKTDFISFHGPADTEGSIAVRGDDILGWAKINRDFAPADYLDPELDWSGSLTLTPLTVDAARAAIKVHSMFKGAAQLPGDLRRRPPGPDRHPQTPGRRGPDPQAGRSR